MNKRLTAYLLLLTASIIWGVAGVVIKYTLQFVSPFQFLFWRFLLTSIITFPIFIWHLRVHPLKLAWFPKIALLGLLVTTVSLSFVFLGFDRTSAIEGTLLTALSPIFIVAGGALFLKEKVTGQEKIGIAIAVIGTVFTILQPLIQDGIKGSSVSGNTFLVLSNISWMGFVLLSKKWESEGLKPFHITALSFFIGAVTFLPIAALEAGVTPSLAQIPSAALPGIFFMSVFSSLIAYTAYEVGLSRVEASEADIFNYLYPIWAAPLAFFFLGEAVTTTFLLGAGLIATGVVIAEYRPGMFKFVKGIRGHHLAHNQ